MNQINNKTKQSDIKQYDQYKQRQQCKQYDSFNNPIDIKLSSLGLHVYDERQLRALTGLSYAEFIDLLPTFHQLIVCEYKSRKRQKALGSGRIGKLGGFTMEHSAKKLLAVLIWLKAYPTYDVFGFIVGVQRSSAQKAIVVLLPILEKTLGRKIVLPERKINTVEEFMEKFPGVKDIFVDATERPIEKPKDPKKRKGVYSGKKKRTTRKHTVLTDEKERILILTKGKIGRRHDKRLAEKAGLFDVLPDYTHKWVDTGYQGIQNHPKIPPDTIHIPTKATKYHKLTPEEKAENTVIGSFRVVVEHAIGHVKRYKASSDIWRGKTMGADDQVMLIASGLWNFHLDHKQFAMNIQ